MTPFSLGISEDWEVCEVAQLVKQEVGKSFLPAQAM
jgi:hypothetical protein